MGLLLFPRNTLRLENVEDGALFAERFATTSAGEDIIIAPRGVYVHVSLSEWRDVAELDRCSRRRVLDIEACDRADRKIVARCH